MRFSVFAMTAAVLLAGLHGFSAWAAEPAAVLKTYADIAVANATHLNLVGFYFKNETGIIIQTPCKGKICL